MDGWMEFDRQYAHHEEGGFDNERKSRRLSEGCKKRTRATDQWRRIMSGRRGEAFSTHSDDTLREGQETTEPIRSDHSNDAPYISLDQYQQRRETANLAQDETTVDTLKPQKASQVLHHTNLFFFFQAATAAAAA